MKSTPVRGVKEYLKSCASKPSEDETRLRERLTACLLEYDPASFRQWPVKAETAGAGVKASLNRAMVADERPETT